ncbi:MAG: peptide chain release factor-like protein [Acidobacteriota bacterium]
MSAGAGPWECRCFVALLAEALATECGARGLTVTNTTTRGEEGAPRSVVLTVTGDVARRLADWLGTHELRTRSPRRAKRSRTRWHVGVELFDDTRSASAEELTIDTVVLRADRAGGPGGQNVNRRATAVRARHEPTGLQVRVTEQRTQGANRTIALKRLAERLSERRAHHVAEADQAERTGHRELERGRPCRRWRLDRRGRLRDATGERSQP